MTVTRTACSYCGVGCGIEVATTTGTDGSRVIARVSGDKLHPANFGRLCTKGATHAEMMAADDGRLNTALLRPIARRRAGARRRSTTPSPRRAGGCARSSTSTAPTRSRCTCRARCRIEAQYLANKLAKGFLRTEAHRVELAAVHGQRGHRLQAVARRRRPARLLQRLRLHRPVLRHRLQHGRLPPDPVPADGRPAQGRRQADRRRPAPHRHRRQGRPVPADQARHRPRPAQRPAAPARRERRTSTPSSSPSTPRAGTAMPAFLADYPPRPGRRDHRHSRGRHPQPRRR